MKYLKLLCLLLVASAIFPALAKSPKDKHKYGVYINLPKDTLGISKKTIDYLKTIEANHKDNESIHLWIFTDSTIIPNSFYADWPTKEIKSKCFAHAAKYHKEYYRYHYNLLGEFKKE